MIFKYCGQNGTGKPFFIRYTMKLLSISALAGLLIAQVASRAVGSDGKLVVGYWTGSDVSTLNFSQLTHVNYGELIMAIRNVKDSVM